MKPAKFLFAIAVASLAAITSVRGGNATSSPSPSPTRGAPDYNIFGGIGVRF